MRCRITDGSGWPVRISSRSRVVWPHETTISFFARIGPPSYGCSAGIMLVKSIAVANCGCRAPMQPLRTLRSYTVYASVLMSLLFIAMADDTEDETPEPTLFEQLGGTEMPNTTVDDVLTVTRNTLGIFINMVAD